MIAVVKKHTPEIIKSSARKVRAQLRSVGARFRCAACESRVRAFLPMPPEFTEPLKEFGFPFTVAEAETCNDRDYLCPICQASDRDRLYALYLRDYLARLPSDKPIKMVDFAPAAALSNLIRGLIQSQGYNVTYRTADLLREDVDDQTDLTDLKSYADHQFDFFICSHVLEHVSDDKKALRELFRILKPGGQGILMVPIILSINEIDEDPSLSDESERIRRFGQSDHVRIYSRSGFLERASAAGFVIKQLGKEFFGANAFAENGITDQSVLYVVEKAT